jgi:trans-aconitate methyltransferase
MGSAWAEFYKGRLLSKGYQDYARERYRPFLESIVSHIKEGDRVIEVGCGLATITLLLAGMKRPWCGFRCFDLCPDMVGLARINLGESKYPVDQGDATVPTNHKPDIVHSHGLLEHLDDDTIVRIIEAERADGARAAIHYVPGEKYEKPSFGDERLMSINDWQRICSPTKITTFNDEHDYTLEWVF